MEFKIKYEKSKFMKLAQNKMDLIKESIKETIEETSGSDQIERGYLQSDLNIRSGNLFSSFNVEKTDTKLRVYSNVIYSRIHEFGGWTGRNHASYLRPTKYFSGGVKILSDEFYLKLRQKIKEKIESKK